MSADQLFDFAVNKEKHYKRIMFAVRQLRSVMDCVANELRNEHAEWADDPQAASYAEFHASADVQFPREMRDEAILELVNHYLAEITLQRTPAVVV